MSYVLLDLMFLGCALLVTFAAVLLRRQQLSRRGVWAVAVALVGVLLLSVVVDNVMIGVGLVAYDPARRAPGWNPDGHPQHTGSASGVGSEDNADVDTGTGRRSGPNLNTTTNASPGPHPRSATSGGNR